MKNKVRVFGLLLAAALAISGCGKKVSPEEETAPIKVEETMASGIELDVTEFTGMLKAVDPLLLARAETGHSYDPADPTFVWKALTYGTGVYYAEIPGAKLTESALAVPATDLLSYAKGLFAGITALPELPEGTEIIYEDDTYFFPLGDRGASYTKLLSAQDGGNGSVLLSASLYGADDNEVVVSASFSLKEGGGELFSQAVTAMNEAAAD